MEVNGSAAVGVNNEIDPLSYEWDDAGACTTATISNLVAGTYHFTVTDAGHPVDSDKSYATVVIAESALLQLASIYKTDISCYTKPDDGIPNATISGGTVPYNYHWAKDGSDFVTTEDLSALSEGIYALTVTDAKGCTTNDVDTIVRTLPLSITTTVKQVTCEAIKNDGVVNLDAPQGGWPTYSYLWSNGLTSKGINLLNKGNYKVTVTDSRNCSVSLSKSVDYDSLMSITFNVNDINCKGASTGNAGTLVSGGHQPLSYSWSNGTVNSGLTGVVAGTYGVTITDSKPCVKSK